MRRVMLFVLFISLSASVCHAEGFGRYIGTVQTEWIEPDRKMRLLAPFTYVDPNGVTWTAPAGWVIDGASIPIFAWSIIGGPYNGKYRNASVIHDVACDQKAQPWESVHEAFYYAMLASGVEPWRAKVMYAAVYHFGPRWPRLVTVSVPKDQAPAARDQALAQAEPGSDASIVAVHPDAPSPSEADREKVDVEIQPPPKQLTENDFEKLKAKIIESEKRPEEPKSAARPRGFSGRGGAGGGGGAGGPAGESFSAGRRGGGGGNPLDLLGSGVSLAEIRNFKPVE
jgi:uncharacterized membrane protein YgcG